MKRTTRFCTLLLLLWMSTLASAQVGSYRYQQELASGSHPWHRIVLPDAIFGKVAADLSDLRIFGITANRDTVEAPYLLRVAAEKVTTHDVGCRVLNPAHDEKGFYYTLEIPTLEAVNEINLTFARANFDWQVSLAGSQDQQDWFTFVEGYRIVSIQNERTNFRFTTVTFPVVKYRYFRLFVNSKQSPELTAARVARQEVEAGVYKTFAAKDLQVVTDKPTQQTEVTFTLALPVPVSQIKVAVQNTFDYYRPVTVDYLADSFKTEQGWRYTYRTLASGTLNSLADNTFKFPSTTAQQFKVTIRNQDNQPLTISNVEVKGCVYELVARFTTPATYFLAYGNLAAAQPQYDLAQFTDRIPDTLTTLALGAVQTIAQAEPAVGPSLFKNRLWLWLTMAVLIGLLGWFTVKMIRVG